MRKKHRNMIGVCVPLAMICWALSACSVSVGTQRPNITAAATEAASQEPGTVPAGAAQTASIPSDQPKSTAGSGTEAAAQTTPPNEKTAPPVTPTTQTAADNTPKASASVPAPGDASGMAVKTGFQTITTEQKPLAPDFVKPGQSLYFNEHEVFTFENKPTPEPGGPIIPDNYAWDTTNDGKSILLILLDADNDWEGENYNLLLPVYGFPAVTKSNGSINVVWTNPADSEDGISLSFKIGGDEMSILKNTPKGVSDNAGYTVKLAQTVPENNSGGGRYYLPLYAILNEIGGGVLINPLGDGTDFIYSGSAFTGYTGMWETSDRGDDRQDAVINGKTVSIATNWQGLELRQDGTFLDSQRYWDESEEWVLTESKGHYAFYGHVLVMRYETESAYLGTDYTALKPDYVDRPAESWGKVTGAAVIARYIDEWDDSFMQINGWPSMYSGTSVTDEVAPRPGIAKP